MEYKDMTLHDSIILAINELGGGKQRVKDVTDYINSHHLYHRRDEAPVPNSQISARLNKYKHLFCYANGYVWLTTN